MQQKHLSSFLELEDAIESVRRSIESTRRHPHHVLSKPLFRGHADATWSLGTTLERYSRRNYSVQAYNAALCATACATQSLTGHVWQMEDAPQLSDSYFSVPPNYEFMAHARHHGFPSPLLDWTQSIYVALFFAFFEAKPEMDVAIYVYVETLGVGKVGWVGSPEISLIGPYVSTHKRHFLQQGQYTIAIEKKNGTWFYCSHARAFEESGGRDQDVIYKFTMPSSLRTKVLIKLQEMNVTAFTLLGDENSLMSTLAFKEIKMRDEESPWAEQEEINDALIDAAAKNTP
jgi:hypothetical protein